MSDLVERLRTEARKSCTRHNGIDQFDLAWRRKPEDFIEWEAANEIEELRSYLDEEREKNEKQVRMTMDAHAKIEMMKEEAKDES
jgi:hypothetical protein